ncbi:MAG: hypothetical protein Q4E61_03650 [Alphaproteobacteria bacterium]|nr:hypothetical protein [Alphaproteobacteria bacterium]
MDGALGVIYTIITVCIVILIILIGLVFFIWWQGKKKTKDDSSKTKQTKENAPKLQGIESISKFLDFDKIVDSMIVRKKGEEYVMVVQCKGVNYDLLGEEEKVAVENGFVQFLNILRFPIQLYIQTRSLNLKGNIEQYEARVNDVRDELVKLDNNIKRETANGRMDVVRRLEFERRRKMNILEYGLDVTNYVSRLSQNRNVLQQNTYLVISYYKSEIGGEVSNYSREEIENIAFSELYTRAQTLIRGLSACAVTGRVLNSEELAELLYIAYNREDSELINIRKSVDAQYDSLYNTAKDALDKQREIIEKKIDEEAIDLTAKSIKKADRELRLRRNNQEEIKERALNYVEAYKNDMTEELYDETKKQIKQANLGEEKKQKSIEQLAEEAKEKRKKARQAQLEARRKRMKQLEQKEKMKKEKPEETEV